MLEIGEDQALGFRARRQHLVDGADDVAGAARAIVGAQAQQEAPAWLALSRRIAARPTAEAVGAALLDDRTVVRTWGQRGTLHIYDPDDWRAVIDAAAEWADNRPGTNPPEETATRALEVFRDAGEPLTRSAVMGLAPQAYLDSMAKFWGDQGERFAAGRLILMLAKRGDLCVAGKQGSEQAYALRSDWFEDLAFDPLGAKAANLRLVRRYLAAFGPATVQDVAHYFGATVATAREWVEALAAELIDVRCGDRDLLALAVDADALTADPPDPWPVVMLPKFDTILMGHADKSWTTAEADRPAVWRKSAQVYATVLDRGRVVAWWTYKKRGKKLAIEVHPLTGWRADLRDAVEAEAGWVSAHLGLQRGPLSFG